MLQAEVGFDQHSDPEQVLLMAVASAAALLLFSPRVLRFLFARVGWPDQDASRLAIPGSLERPFFAAVGLLVLGTTLWALISTTGWHENEFMATLRSATVPLAWAAVALFGAAACGGPILIFTLLQFSLDRWLGRGREALLLGSAGYSLTSTLAQVGSLRLDLLVVNAIVGALFVIAVRKLPRLASLMAIGMIVFVLLSAAVLWVSWPWNPLWALVFSQGS